MRIQKSMTGEQWIELIGKDKLQAFQDSFAKLNGISLVFQDIDGKPLTVWSNQPLICNVIADKNGASCESEKKKNISNMRGRLSPMITRCFLGIVNFTIPVCYNHQIVAYCSGGGNVYENSQFSPHSMSKYHINKISEDRLKIIVEALQHFLSLLDMDADILAKQQESTMGAGDPFGGLLSRREQEVAQAICSGMTNKEVATKLFISEKTVKSHVSNILLKLNLNDRVQLVLNYCRYVNQELSDKNEARNKD